MSGKSDWPRLRRSCGILVTVGCRPSDRGRERLSPSPPSEPGVQFSRDGLSSQLFPHRDWHADLWAFDIVNSPR
ncbi:MAG: hypothetical protein LUQ29_07980, partial [Methylococcaceae bacterium]|nr:hypothetical protein [Methylococcaceae bacterium]